MHVLGVVLIVFLWWASGAEAACSGSGLSWTCTPGTAAGSSGTSGTINWAIASASDGATITFQAGTYSTSGIDLGPRNGVTLACVSVGACTFTAAANIIDTENSCTGPITNLWRITGFAFTGANGGTARIWVFCNQNINQLRIDNNDFQIGMSEIAVLLGELSTPGHIYGVMDHNYCHATSNFMCMKNISGGPTSTGWMTGQQGSANAFFFEDNRCNFTTYPDTGTGCVDEWRASSSVLRFNTLTNSRFVNHSYCHEGPYNSEIYGNVISNPAFSGAPNYRNIHFQGSGEIIAWGNQVELATDPSNTLVIQHFRSDSSTATSEGNCNSVANGTVTGSGLDSSTANDGNRSPNTTYFGYPAWHQPGRDKNGTLKPIYLFKNASAAGTPVTVDVQSGSWTGNQADCANTDNGRVNCHLQLNRDIYVAVSASAQTSPTSPFNGTSGVGFGTLANRPASCTPNQDPSGLDAADGGVGYWAMDQGNWNTSTSNPYGVQMNGTDGVLYRCSATNTWTLHYTPFIYPHPLVIGSGGGSGGGTTRPTAPTNLRVQ